MRAKKSVSMVWNMGSGTRCLMKGWGKGDAGVDGPGPVNEGWFKDSGTRLSGISSNESTHLVEMESGYRTAWEEALEAYGS